MGTYRIWQMKALWRSRTYTASLQASTPDPLEAQHKAEALIAGNRNGDYVYVLFWDASGRGPAMTYDSLSGWYVAGDPRPALAEFIRTQGGNR